MRVFKKGIITLLLCVMFASVFVISSHAAETIHPPDTVRIWRHSNTALRIKWSKVKKADGYIIYKYNAKTKKYKKYKIIKDQKTDQFIDEIGSRKSAKYKVSAYKIVKGKRVVSTKSYYVRARTYQQGDKKVNAGKSTIKIEGSPFPDETLAYHETLKLKAKIKASTYSKAKGKTSLSTKVRWYSTNPQIAKVDKTGLVTAQTKAGKCYIYARLHNGKKSNKIEIEVENYAKPDKNDLNVQPAYDDQDLFGMVLQLFGKYYDTTTDIAEYFYMNRPRGNETFKCEMENGVVKITSNAYVSEEMQKKIYKFVEKFPYDVRVYANSNMVWFTQMRGVGEYRKTGVNVTFLFDKLKSDPYPYSKVFELESNWFYGYFPGQ